MLSTCSRDIAMKTAISMPASSMLAGMRSTPSRCERMPSAGVRGSPAMTAARWSASVVSRESGAFQPSDLVRSPCGSVSTSSTRFPRRARATPRLRVVAVLPVPPFWLATAMVLHGMVCLLTADESASGGQNGCFKSECRFRAYRKDGMRTGWRREKQGYRQEIQGASVSSAASGIPLPPGTPVSYNSEILRNRRHVGDSQACTAGSSPVARSSNQRRASAFVGALRFFSCRCPVLKTVEI